MDKQQVATIGQRPESEGSPIEQELALLWQQVLRRPSVSRTDDFFELGGTSLAVIELLALVGPQFGVSLTLHDFLENPKLHEQAARIEASRRGDKQFAHLITMAKCSKPSAPPLFILPGMFGQLYVLRDLANCLGREFNVYGFKARGVDDNRDPRMSIEEMLETYLAELREQQPHGPYYLTGYCTGSWLAMEIARRLKESGETIALLALVDTFLPTEAYPSMTGEERRRAHLQELKQKGLGYIVDWARKRATWEFGKIRRKLFGVDPRVTPGDLRAWPVADAFMEAASRCKITAYPGKATLIRAPLDRKFVMGPGRVFNSLRAFVLPDHGLTPFVTELSIHEVPGDHDSMLEHPNVELVARNILAAIRL